jgi:hypothetical protein
MRPIQELHKADSIFHNTRRAVDEYGRVLKAIEKFAEINDSNEHEYLQPIITIHYGIDGLAPHNNSFELTNSAIKEILEIANKCVRDKVQKGVNELEQLGYQYNPFNEENK